MTTVIPTINVSSNETRILSLSFRALRRLLFPRSFVWVFHASYFTHVNSECTYPSIQINLCFDGFTILDTTRRFPSLGAEWFDMYDRTFFSVNPSVVMCHETVVLFDPYCHLFLSVFPNRCTVSFFRFFLVYPLFSEHTHTPFYRKNHLAQCGNLITNIWYSLSPCFFFLS